MQIEESVQIEAPPSAVWARLSDVAWHRRAFGSVARWESQDGSIDVGARVDFRVQVGAAPVGGVIEIVTYDPDRRLEWEGVSGVIGDGGWQLSELRPGVTSVSLSVTYRVPGPVGPLAEGAAAANVHRTMAGALEALRREAEEGEPQTAPPVLPPPGPVPLGLLGASFTLARSGVLRPSSLSALARAAPGLVRSGLTPAGAYAYGAARFRDKPAIIDEKGSWTFLEMHRRIDSLASALADEGIGPDDRLALLCRNHRRFVEATAALSMLGTDIVFLNTSFAAPQLLSLLEQERIRALVLDEDFVPLADSASIKCLLAWSETEQTNLDRLEDLDGGKRRRLLPAPGAGSRYVLLTSGTTGRPRPAARSVPLTLDPVVGLLSRIPMQVGDSTLIASPLFHALGFGQLSMSWLLSSTVVLRRFFDPESTLAAIAQHRVRVLVVVPLMLRRLAGLPAVVRDRYDTSSLEVVVSSGSALSGELATRFMDAYGETLYNIYGSTEAAWATIARPHDLRAAPGTVGRPPRGTVARVFDASGSVAPVGVTGRIFVGSRLSVDPAASVQASTGGQSLVPTGDLGHVDELGRLFVDGREDDMIVSGGENVYPQPVEDELATHPAIEESAVVGVPDAEFGQRLRALVVLRPGHHLTSEQVRRYLRRRIPRYMVPREVVFVDALPHNELGKTLHNMLRT